MNELVALAISGHGGIERWEEISHFRGAGSITGAIWTMKGKGGLLDDVMIEGEARDQRLTITPFPEPGRYATWEPQTQTIESTDGRIILERPEPRAAFVGQTRESEWDDFQVAYFASEVTWNYFVAPFVLARPDFTVKEVEPWREDGEAWRSLLVTYPDDLVAHTRPQTYYFDERGLLRRLDYSVDVLGGDKAVDYPSDYREFDGIMVPTRRRVYLRKPDGTPVRDAALVAIDISDVIFT